MPATIIHFRSNGETATAIGGGGTFIYSQHVPSFIREKRNQQAESDKLRIGDIINGADKQ